MTMGFILLGLPIITLSVMIVPSFGASLYSFDEPVWQLHATNFTVNVHNSQQAWIVEFYADWCGHCKRYAPLWTTLARGVEGWQDVVRVAVVNCADIENTGLCRLYSIRGYPSIKFFPPFASFEYKGHSYGGSKNVTVIRNEIVSYLDSMAMTPDGWPRLEPYTSLEAISSQLQDFAQIYVIMEDVDDETTDPYLGSELVLDSTSLNGVRVVRMLRERALSHGVEEYPSLYRLQNGQLLHLASNLNRSEFFEIIRDEAPLQDIRPTGDKPRTTTPHTTRVTTTMPTPSSAPSSGLHRHDLDGMIRYALFQEISTYPSISGRALTALKDFIKIMAKYFPGEKSTLQYLRKIRAKLKYKTEVDTMTAGEWQQIISYNTDDAYLPARTGWASCAGSEPNFRGYPCAVWMTFHAITVNAYNMALRNPDKEFHPEEVLVAMREYIRHFFGCRHCAEHFVNMASQVEHDVTNGSEAIMWLWRSHNLVNQRLQGDHTEDPRHPKIQYPSPEDCSQCRREIRGRYGVTKRWREAEVLPYLLEVYSAQNMAGGRMSSAATRPSAMSARTVPITTSTLLPTTVTTTLHAPTEPTTLQVFKVTFSPRRRWNSWADGRRSYPGQRQTFPDQRQTYPGSRPPIPRPWTPRPPRPQTHRPPTYSLPAAAERSDWTPWNPGTPIPYWSRRTARTQRPYWTDRTPSSDGSTQAPFTDTAAVTMTTVVRPIIPSVVPPVVSRRTQAPSVPPSPSPPPTRTPSVYVEQPYNSCHLEATDWTGCSVSCGTGLSTRMSNYNPGCRMQLEVRLCNFRPCQAVYTQPATGGCGATYRTYGRQNLRYGDCYSVRHTRWRYCGLCEGKCCHPVTSETEWLEMVCYHDYKAVRGYMQAQIIDLCECGDCN